MTNADGSAASSPVDDLIKGLSEFDPACLYEVSGHRGMVDPSIRPAWPSAKVCGRALTLECPPGDNLMLHVAVAHAPAGAVLVANAGSYMLAGAWGEILTAAAQARGIAGLVIDGAVRDIEAIQATGFPVFSRGRAIGSCTKERIGRINVPIQVGGCTVHPGDLILGDADGLVVVAWERAHAIYQAAQERRTKEQNIIAGLRAGRTTIELLRLNDPVPQGQVFEQ